MSNEALMFSQLCFIDCFKIKCPEPVNIIISSKKEIDLKYDSYDAGSVFRYIVGENFFPCIIFFDKKNNINVFLDNYDAKKWLWDGDRFDFDHPPESLKKCHIYLLDDFEQYLLLNLDKNDTVFTDFTNVDFMKKIQNYNLCDINLILDKMRMIKNVRELDFLKIAVEKSVKSHLEIMKQINNMQSENEIMALFMYNGLKHGVRDLAYTPIIASGNNANILHYTKNNKKIKNNDWILIDAAWRFNGYCADLTRSYPVNNANSRQVEVYNALLKIQEDLISFLQVGLTWRDMNNMMREMMCEFLFSYGLIPHNDIKYTHKYCPHSVGHCLGLDVHDVGCRDEVFQPGMVVTIEPGLYFSENDQTLPSELRGLGLRIEDNILILPSGRENLSKYLPKKLEEIYAIRES